MTGRVLAALSAEETDHQWLCPRHRALIRHDAEAALALWQQLEWLADQGQLASPTLQLARWHVALDVIESLLANGRAEALTCLLAVAQALVPTRSVDECLLLRLHDLLCTSVGASTGFDDVAPRFIADKRIPLSGWLTLLEHRLTRDVTPASLSNTMPTQPQ